MPDLQKTDSVRIFLDDGGGVDQKLSHINLGEFYQTPEQEVAQVELVSQCGLDWVLCDWMDFVCVGSF